MGKLNKVFSVLLPNKKVKVLWHFSTCVLLLVVQQSQEQKWGFWELL